MVAYSLTVALLGLSAVYALPTASTVEERQIFGIGEGSGGIGSGSGNLKPCSPTIPLEQQPPCIFSPIGGGIKPGKAKRQISLGDPTNLSEQRAAIAALQQQLIVLQNKKNKTDAEVAQIAALQAMIAYKEGILSISAPEGTESSFTHGRRQTLVLPPDYKTNTKQVIKDLQTRLIKLQNKKNKTPNDVSEIKAIKAALQYLAGIVSISAPDGSSSTFVPGKRSVSLDSVGTYSSASVCSNLEAAELAYEKLMQSKTKLSVKQYIVFKQLEHFLAGCGIKIIQVPDGTSTIIKPSDKKRDVVSLTPLSPDFDLAGLETSYRAMIQSLGSSSPSFGTWLALQQIADLLQVYGVTVDRSAATFTPLLTPKRQIAIGGKACELTDIMGLKAALAALLTAYGDPSKAPTNIFLIEQVIVTALQICGQSVQGWTTLTPGNPIPGAPMVPDKTVPGGAIVPDKPVPGAPLKPSDKRQVPVKDPAALLDALHLLEKQYGTYGSGKIPVPIFLIMVNMVTILQDIPGVVVPGWPVLGQGSVSIYPSP
ncbi:hypothetical protein QBC37DRAFT_281875 [Rhypophila decipiens]|uniref:Uncharacterized protein n=1 Tax=Rhypophila decipiens TaxID=261697 RepID=A0AAN6YA99_9PEZI|nr:hypothetical protein QBC37DRAFT_281875 [Rhypophila decipiens]